MCIYYSCFNLDYRARASIRQAMEELSQKSCIRFVLITNLNLWTYPNRVYFTPGNGLVHILKAILALTCT